MVGSRVSQAIAEEGTVALNNNNNNKDICKAPNAKASKRIKRTLKYTNSERNNYK